MEREVHPIPPVWNRESRILILGSFPSVKSREGKFFYHHPRNRFWAVTAEVLGCPVPDTIEEKRKMLLENRTALWDVAASCSIHGSSDSSIRDVIPNNLGQILEQACIRQIFTNGTTAYRLYRKYTEPVTGIPAVCLPSTSPANAAWSLPHLVQEWSVIRRYLNDEPEGIPHSLAEISFQAGK